VGRKKINGMIKLKGKMKNNNKVNCRMKKKLIEGGGRVSKQGGKNTWIPHFLVKLVFTLRGQNKMRVSIFHKVTLPG